MLRLAAPLVLVLVAGLALADPAPKPQRFDFTDDVVEAGLPRPDPPLVGSAVRPARERLLRVRRHFIPELLRSAEDR